MQKLVRGIHTFQQGFFRSHRRLFERLATKGQHPETLFITCTDSRVDPTLITDTDPGELFIVRNVGNVVPPLSLPGGNAAAIEYAVELLNVSSIIVCGHTHCGAIEAILNPERVAHLRYVRRWVESTIDVKELVEEKYGHLDEQARLNVAVQENVLAQLKNLKSYPFIARRLQAGTLSLNGWVFDVRRGEVFDFDPEAGEFLPLRWVVEEGTIEEGAE